MDSSVPERKAAIVFPQGGHKTMRLKYCLIEENAMQILSEVSGLIHKVRHAWQGGCIQENCERDVFREKAKWSVTRPNAIRWERYERGGGTLIEIIPRHA